MLFALLMSLSSSQDAHRELRQAAERIQQLHRWHGFVLQFDQLKLWLRNYWHFHRTNPKYVCYMLENALRLAPFSPALHALLCRWLDNGSSTPAKRLPVGLIEEQHSDAPRCSPPPTPVPQSFSPSHLSRGLHFSRTHSPSPPPTGSRS